MHGMQGCAICLAFDAFELDLGARELRKNGVPVSLEPKVFDLLVCLISKRERVVSKEELNEAVWLGRIVSDAALDTCIKSARRAIGDDGKAQQKIRTLPRRGFRFVAAVLEHMPSAGKQRVSASAGDASSVLGSEVPSDVPPLKLPDQPSIAVLPFENLTPQDDRFAFAEGLFRDITTRLGRARWLFVIARGSSSQFAVSKAQEAGTRLGVRYVVQGSVQSRANRVRVNIALVDTVERAEVWAEIFDRNIDDVFAVQDEITDAIVLRVQSELEQSERRRAFLKPLASLTAWSAYHRACWHLDRHTPDDYDRAEHLFKHAAGLDPGAARVFAGLSYVHRQRAFLELTNDRAGEVSQTYELAQQSLAFDPNDAQAHWVMGRALMLRNDVRPALAEFEMASLLNPSFAMGRYSVGLSSSMLGESAPSDAALLAAIRLSPIDPMRFAMIAAQAFNAAHEGDLDRSTELAQLAASQPNAHHHIVALAAICNALAGRNIVAERYRQRLEATHPGYTSANFFRTFPFQREEHMSLWKKGFHLLGVPE